MWLKSQWTNWWPIGGFCSALMPFKKSFLCYLFNTVIQSPNLDNESDVPFNVMKLHKASDQSSCLEHCFPIRERTKAWLVLRGCGRC